MKKWNSAYYPFASRDDGFRLWDTLHRYVEGVLKFEYPSDKVEEDPNSWLGNLTSQTIAPDLTYIFWVERYKDIYMLLKKQIIHIIYNELTAGGKLGSSIVNSMLCALEY